LWSELNTVNRCLPTWKKTPRGRGAKKFNTEKSGERGVDGGLEGEKRKEEVSGRL
jgi:hypothetical protein